MSGRTDGEDDDEVAPEPHDLANARALGWLQHAVQAQSEDMKEIKELLYAQTRDAEAARREAAEQFGALRGRLEDVEAEVKAFTPIAQSIARWRERSWGLLALIAVACSIGLSLLADLGSAIIERLAAAF